MDFNTSNVTIQLFCTVILFSLEVDFNTSNVTIQRFRFQACDFSFHISIHLMLLFNAGGQREGKEKIKFQYI